MSNRTVYTGTFVHTPQLGTLEILRDYVMLVNNEGIIEHLKPIAVPRSKEILELYPKSYQTIPSNSFLLPAFYDLHLHAPQYLYAGTGLHLPLMEWLDAYAFKAEEKIDMDRDLAAKVYGRLTERLAACGTGTTLLFGTLNIESNLILARAFQNRGLCGLIGKLSMDISSRPTYKESSAEDSLRQASTFVTQCQDTVSGLAPHRRLIEPVITPRFVPTCSDTLLRGLASLSESQNILIQSHMAESADQMKMVQTERQMNDVEVFDKAGLLTNRTVQAHCTFCHQGDLDLMSWRGTAVAHCPLSNAYFSSKPFSLREALDAGVKVGLGSDIAGGYSIDMMAAMRMAVIVSRMRQSSAQPNGSSLAIDWKESLYLATRGGAIALNRPHNWATFTVGASFDCQQIDLASSDGVGIGNLDFFENTNAFCITEDSIEKWWATSDQQNRSKLWMRGFLVWQAGVNLTNPQK